MLVTVVSALLAALALGIYWPTIRYEFINYDDDIYVYNNSLVAAGWTLKGVVFAFCHSDFQNWVPLTTLSHMADYQLYGLNAGGHHFTNVLLHTISAIVLFLVFHQMTGALWRSAFIAALFAVHPLHVESVAWVAERKDTLGGLFFMLTLWAYVRYVRESGRRWTRLVLFIFFALGLMAKPIVITLPFVCLLLDYWPLNRFARTNEPIAGRPNTVLSRFGRLLVEKIPLLVLSAACALVTVLAEKPNIASTETLPVFFRVQNALVAYAVYLEQTFWPIKLGLPYPYPAGGLPVWKVVVSFILLAAVFVWVIRERRKRPFLLVGWLWWVGMLVPVIGLVQVGEQAHADRHMYLPQIGLSLMVVWLVAEFASTGRKRLCLGGIGMVAVLLLAVAARRQCSFWKNSASLWLHTLAVTSGNCVAHYNFGNVLLREKRWDEAIAHFRTATEIRPDYVPAYNNWANALLSEGQVNQAVDRLQMAIALQPNSPEPENNLGGVLVRNGQIDEAIIHFQKAVANNPRFAVAYDNLGSALVRKGQWDEAVVQFEKAVAVDPAFAPAHIDLGNVLLQKGRTEEAINHFRKAVFLAPGSAIAFDDLGAALLRQGLFGDAIDCFKHALVLQPGFANAENNLGITLLRKGRIDEAVICFQKTLDIEPASAEAIKDLAQIAWISATSPDPSFRNGNRALTLARQVDRLTGGTDPMVVAAIAAAYAETGRFLEAMDEGRRALLLAGAQNKPEIAAAIQKQLEGYGKGIPFRETALSGNLGAGK